MKGAAGGTSKPLPPRPAPALPYIGGAGGGRCFARECVPPPAPFISPWGGVLLGSPDHPRGNSARVAPLPRPLVLGRPPERRHVSRRRSLPEDGRAGLTGEC